MAKRWLWLVALALTGAGAGEQILWYAQPASKWAAEALPLGAGDLGAMLFGGLGCERLQFNEKSLWTGDENDTGAYQAFGDVLIQLGHDGASDYRRELDLRRAVQRTSYTLNGVHFVREAFASHPANTLVWRLSADKPGACSGRVWLSDMHDADLLAVPNGLRAVGQLNNGLRYESQLRVVPTGGTLVLNGSPGAPLPRGPRGPAVLDGTRDVYLSLKDSDRPHPAYHDTDDCDLRGRPLVLGGQWFDRGVSFTAPGAFAWPTAGKYRWVSFHATADDAVAVQVWGDGKLVRELALEKGAAPLYACVPIEGVRQVKLVTSLPAAATKRRATGVLLGHLRLSPAATEPARDPGVVRSQSAEHLPGFNGSLPPASLDFQGCDSLTLLLTAGTNYLPDGAAGWRGADPHERLTRQVEALAAASFAELRAAHRRDYESLFNRVDLDLGASAAEVTALPTDQRLVRYAKGGADPEFEALLCQYGRYLLLASSRPGGLPANLQGVWNDSNTPAWRCDYHTDLNVQMNYWLAGPANLAECDLPLFDWLNAGRAVHLRQTAAQYHVRGWTSRGENGIFGGSTWSWVAAGSAWLCQNLWDHYAFTGDREYLAKLYPLLKEVSQFWEDRLVALPDGTLVAPKDFSPEHGPTEDGVSFVQELVWDVLNNTVEASRDLDIEADYRAKLASLRDKLLVPKIGKWGQLQEWMVDRDDPNDRHRHTSHLIAVYPGRQISPLTTPALAKAAEISLEARGTTADGRQSWTWPWRCALWARLGRADKAYEMLRGSSTYNRYPNLFTHMGVFQIDGNLGTTAGVAEMLLQSHAGELQLLPALPSAWPTGKVTGLGARGGFTVDLEWRDGRVTSFQVHAAQPRSVKVRVNGESRTVTTEARR